jgi:flagellar biosynthesis protein FliP
VTLLLVTLILAAVTQPATAADITLFSVSNGADTEQYNVKLQILFLMTMIGFLPGLLIVSTSFTRIIIVLAILRQAIGLQQSPPNQVLVAVALCITLLIMRPVWTTIYDEAFKPFDEGKISLEQAVSTAEVPIRQFMLKQVYEINLEQTLRIAGEPTTLSKSEIPFGVLLPAFVLSEMKTAFQIGFMLFIPFLVIDIVIASILMAMGMMMLSPLVISLPFKLMIFVLVDGWGMTVGTLSNSFGTL